jgi:hypothetical protein
VERWNELAGGQATTAAQLRELPRHDPSLWVERILMMDYASTQSLAKGVVPTAGYEDGHTEATTAKPLKASPLPTTDGVDKMYR